MLPGKYYHCKPRIIELIEQLGESNKPRKVYLRARDPF